MKTFLNWFLPLVILLFVGCSDRPKVVTNKYNTSLGDPLPKGLCKFYYGDQEFIDSCHYYYVGDTITNHRPR